MITYQLLTWGRYLAGSADYISTIDMGTILSRVCW